MVVANYLPSAQFSLIVISLAAAGGLVLAADYVTSPSTPSRITVSPTQGVETRWQETLAAIQAQNPLGQLPPAPNPNAVEELRAAAQTSNITNTVARTLLINLSEAKSQGLGSDIPTQDALVAEALAQIGKGRGEPIYTSADLTISSESQAAYKAYGNGIMRILSSYPGASFINTVLAIGSAADTAESGSLSQLSTIQTAYRALTQELVALPVPPTLVPLHLQVVNDLGHITSSYDDMRLVLEDPLRALAGFELYRSLTDELNRVFINIAQTFSRNGILFTEEEPGSAWKSFLAQP